MRKQGYICDRSILGNVYYPEQGVRIEEPIEIKYVEYPWITRFEVSGIFVDKDD